MARSCRLKCKVKESSDKTEMRPNPSLSIVYCVFVGDSKKLVIFRIKILRSVNADLIQTSNVGHLAS